MSFSSIARRVAVVLSMSLFSLSAQAQVSLTGPDEFENFISLPPSGTSNLNTTLPPGWLMLEGGSGGDLTYAGDNGSTATGNTYSYGIGPDRALGTLLTTGMGAVNSRIGACFHNATGATIKRLRISYRGEQWRLGGAGTDRLDFEIHVNPATFALNAAGTWVALDNLDFNSPVTAGTAGAVDGNQIGNFTNISATIDNLAVLDGDDFCIRWLDFNLGGNPVADHGLAIDDFLISTPGLSAIALAGGTHAESFNSLSSSSPSASMPDGWTLRETGTSADFTYTADSGGTTGDSYSYGSTSATDRALGSLQSNALAPRFGACFENATGRIITSLAISYTGEQWRNGNTTAVDRIDFQYNTSPGSLEADASGTWTDVNALDFSSPITTGNGDLDGNLAANRTSISGSITGLSMAPGSQFCIRWTDLDVANGEDGLGVDDFSITPTTIPNPQSITFTSTAPAAASYGGAAYTPTATGGGSGNPVVFTIDASASSVCSISAGVVSFIGVGTCTINANQAGNANYDAAAQAQQSFAVAKSNQTIGFTSSAPSGATFGGATYTPAATATSGLTVSFAIDASASSVCSISAGVVSFIGVGTCTINANQAGNANYNAAAQAQQSFAVATSNQTISFTSSAPGAASFGGASYTPTATASSGLAVGLSIDGTASTVCSISAGVVSFIGVGNCMINANQAGNANYNAAPQAQQSFAVGQASQSISFTGPADTTYGAPGPTLSAIGGASGYAVEFTSNTPAVCLTSGLNGQNVTIASAGTCTIAANQPGNTNYSAAPEVTRSFNIAQATQAISFTGPADTTYGAPGPTLSAIGGASGYAVEFTSNTPAVCLTSGLNGQNVTIASAGTCTIAANQPGNTNYSAAPEVTRSFNIAQATQSISFTGPSNTTYGAPGPTLSALGGASGNPVEFTSNTPSVCLTSGLNGQNVTIASAGTCTIAANQLGNTNYLAAPEVTQSFNIAQATQSISFTSTAPAAATVGGAIYTPTATGGASGNPVVLGIDGSANSVCEISAGDVYFIGVGTCTINADQAGNINYLTAPQVQQSFSVAAGTTVPDAPTIGTATAGDASADVSFTVPGNDGGSAIIDYTAVAYVGGMLSGQTGSCASSPCTVTGLDNGTEYTFTVFATNAVDDSVESAQSNAVTPAPGQLDPTIRVSVSSANLQGDDISNSGSKVVSADGRYVVFESDASNLVAGDSNGFADVFLRDTQTGITTRVSVDSAGGQGNDDSGNPAISPNGRYVAFASLATNLVTGDTNGKADMFVHDTQTGSTSRISVDSAEVQGNGDSYGPALSADGQYVAFYSIANNLVASDTNGQWDIFVRDTVAGTTTRVSVVSGGAQAGSSSFTPAISADGRYVAFQSLANNLVTGDTNANSDVFLHDTSTTTTTRVSVAAGGVQATGGASFNPSLSADGRYVAFVSDATNLVAGDTNATRDSFVHDTATGTTTRISVDSVGTQTTAGDSVSPALSGDARYVIYHSAASNLVTGDANGVDDAFVRDNITGTTLRVSVGMASAEANGGSFNPSISADSRYLVFHSDASNLVTGDTNGVADVFRVENPLYAPPTVPDAPTIGIATAGDASATVAFTAFGYSGGSPITGFTAMAYISGVAQALTGTCASSPCTVTGLANGTAYTFTVHATNAVGDSVESAQSNAVTPQGAQTINFTSSAPGAATVGGATYTPSATATSGLTVALTIDAASSSVCSISSGTVSFIGAGTCTINANQAGNAAFLPAPQVQQSFTVGQGNQTISFTSSAPGAATIGGTTYTPAATATSGLTVALTIDAASSSVCSINAGVVSFIGAGTCTINANQAGNGNYNAAPQVQQSFTVSKNNQSISFTSSAPGAATVGGATYTPTAIATSGLAVTITIAGASSSVCSISAGTVSFIGSGTCTINANQAGNTNYNAAPQVQQSFAVGSGVSGLTLTMTDETVKEGGATTGKVLTFKVKLSRIATAPVTFNITTVNGSALAGSDFVAKSQTGLSIPTGASSVIFVVSVIGDAVAESTESFTVVISSASGATILDDTGVGTITDDDAAAKSSAVAYLPLALHAHMDASALAQHLDEAMALLCGQDAPAIAVLPGMTDEAREALEDALALRTGCAPYALHQAAGSRTLWLVDATRATATVRGEPGASWLDAQPYDTNSRGLSLMSPETAPARELARSLRQWQQANPDQALVVMGQLGGKEQLALRRLGLSELDKASESAQASRTLLNPILATPGRARLLRGDADQKALRDEHGPMLLIIEP